jgi:hypothetical protein
MRRDPARGVGAGGGGAAGGGGSGTALTRRVSHAASAGGIIPRRGGTLGRVRIVFGIVVASVALVGAGCGSSDEVSATESWASDLCTSVQTWSDAVQAAGTTLQDTSSLSPESVGDALEGVIDATSTLADDVTGLGPPDTESGEQAQDTVTELADMLQTDASTLQSALDDAGDSGLTGLLEQISTITTTLGSMASAVAQAFSDLRELDVQGELESAFTDAEACDGLARS